MNNNKKHIAINTHVFLPISLFVIFIIFSASSINNNEFGLAIGFAIFALVFLFGCLISPIYYIFSNDSVIIVYLLGLKEEIKWNYIRNITRKGAWGGGVEGPPHYNISYPTNQKRYFFMNGDISKNRKTNKLLNKFYKKDIK
ncbi:MAG: hypothetical protein E7593_02065 [Ruminococcaceae bacterium]|nr:hypothetical protein [Oscillospiraceae bacterium]